MGCPCSVTLSLALCRLGHEWPASLLPVQNCSRKMPFADMVAYGNSGLYMWPGLVMLSRAVGLFHDFPR
jgi:hypothetical protein